MKQSTISFKVDGIKCKETGRNVLCPCIRNFALHDDCELFSEIIKDFKRCKQCLEKFPVERVGD